MSLESYQIIISPVITEESQIQVTKGGGNQYTFRVHPKATKSQIRTAIEDLFKEVKVARVNTMNYQGKVKGLGVRRGGRTSKWKKAVVTLRPGDTIELI